MIIECTIQREGGSTIKLGKKDYVFIPGEDGCHCCDVDNNAHIERFLSIPESFKEHGTPDVEIEDVILEPEVVAPAGMTNAQLNEWAKSKGINPKNKQSIIKYVLENYNNRGITFLKTDNTASMLRQVVTASLTKNKNESG